MTGTGSLTVLYDGSCGRCCRSIRWAQRHLTVTLVTQDSGEISDEELFALGLSRDAVDDRLWCVDDEGMLFGGASGIAEILQRCSGLFRATGNLLATRSGLRLVEPIYRIVASRRTHGRCELETTRSSPVTR